MRRLGRFLRAQSQPLLFAVITIGVVLLVGGGLYLSNRDKPAYRDLPPASRESNKVLSPIINGPEDLDTAAKSLDDVNIDASNQADLAEFDRLAP